MFYPKTPIRSPRKSSVIGTMPVRGQNNKDDSQFLDPSSAQYILNYYIEGLAKLTKRKGILRDVETDSALKDVWMEWDDTYDIVAYDQYIKLYNRTTEAFTTIKSDLTSTETHEGAPAGDYAFITNKTDGVIRIKRKLTYNLTADYSGNNYFTFSTGTFTSLADNTITGVDSGAVGEIVSYTGIGANEVGAIVTVTSGTFENGESINITTNVGATTWGITSLNGFAYYDGTTPAVGTAVLPQGTKVTGQTSGFTAKIIYDSTYFAGAGAGEVFMTLTDVVGTPQVGEYILGDKIIYSSGGTDLYGRAKITSYGVIAEELYDIGSESAPKAGGVSVNGTRVFLYDLSEDQSATNYCAIPTADSTTLRISEELGDNFQDSALLSQGGMVSYSQAGAARSCVQIGDIYVTFCDNGWYAWTIDQVSLSTSIGKSNTIVASRIDAGGARGALVTPIGLLVANEAGVTSIYGLGVQNMPYSKQAKLLTDSLGEEFFEDVSFTDCSMAYDERRQVVYVACAKNSSINNVVLVIRAESGTSSTSGAQGAVTLFDWPVHRFLKRDDGTLYATTTDGDLYQLDVGSDDNGAPIHTEYLQELNFGLTDLFNLEEWYWKGELSNASSINVSFDTFDKDMYYRENVKNYTWAPTNSYSVPSGWGESGWGETGFGGGSSISGLVEDLKGARPQLRNLSRVRIRFTSDDHAPHIVNWMSGSVSPVRSNRRRTSPNS